MMIGMEPMEEGLEDGLLMLLCQLAMAVCVGLYASMPPYHLFICLILLIEYRIRSWSTLLQDRTFPASILVRIGTG
jgi:hypothetical protein